MVKLIRTDSSNEDFDALVKLLDAELFDNYGEVEKQYQQFNKFASIINVVLAYSDGVVVGCGAIKVYDPSCMELKRMFVSRKFRGLGIGILVLNELQNWSKELGCKRCILETGIKQIEAINMYKKMGYIRIPNYDQYDGLELSVCFSKEL